MSISGCALTKRSSLGISHLAAKVGGMSTRNTGASSALSCRVASASRWKACCTPGSGQRQRLRFAQEQGNAQVLLERLDLVAHSRRSDEQLVGRPGEARMAGSDFEGPERVQRGKLAGHVSALPGDAETPRFSPSRVNKTRLSPASCRSYTVSDAPAGPVESEETPSDSREGAGAVPPSSTARAWNGNPSGGS